MKNNANLLEKPSLFNYSHCTQVSYLVIFFFFIKFSNIFKYNDRHYTSYNIKTTK